MTDEEQQVIECARLRVALEASERARQAAEEERDDVLELVADDAVRAARLHAVATLRVALADAELILEQRERQLTAALTFVAEERARCATVCREVSCFYHQEDIGSVVALACADEIERESVSAPLRAPGA